MKTSDVVAPSEVNISEGLVKIMTVHIVARSIARSIVQLMQCDDSWRSFTLMELSAFPSCRENISVVSTSLHELVAGGFLSSHTYSGIEYFAPIDSFFQACMRQRKRDEHV